MIVLTSPWSIMRIWFNRVRSCRLIQCLSSKVLQLLNDFLHVELALINKRSMRVGSLINLSGSSS
jgi:hypothetical protein